MLRRALLSMGRRLRTPAAAYGDIRVSELEERSELQGGEVTAVDVIAVKRTRYLLQ